MNNKEELLVQTLKELYEGIEIINLKNNNIVFSNVKQLNKKNNYYQEQRKINTNNNNYLINTFRKMCVDDLDEITMLANKKTGLNNINNLIINNIPFTMTIIKNNEYEDNTFKYGKNNANETIYILSNILKCCIKEKDILIRWSNNEFLLIKPNSTLQNSNNIVQLLIKQLENNIFVKGINKKINLTVDYKTIEYNNKKTYEENYITLENTNYKKMYKKH